MKITMNSRKIGGDYYRWLIDIVGDMYEGKSYLLLLKDLWATDFIWTVPNDDNRHYDALDLRSEYTNENMGSESSLLEVMITIAAHMNDMMFDPIYGECIDVWFWELIENLELTIYDDENYNGRNIEDILYILLNREYDFNGKGSLFPLQNGSQKCHKNCNKHRNSVEIWYQMNDYLMEKDLL